MCVYRRLNGCIGIRSARGPFCDSIRSERQLKTFSWSRHRARVSQSQAESVSHAWESQCDSCHSVARPCSRATPLLLFCLLHHPDQRHIRQQAGQRAQAQETRAVTRLVIDLRASSSSVVAFSVSRLAVLQSSGRCTAVPPPFESGRSRPRYACQHAALGARRALVRRPTG